MTGRDRIICMGTFGRLLSVQRTYKDLETVIIRHLHEG